MVIYQLSHPGFLSWIIIHRFTKYEDQKAVLITDDFNPHDNHISLGGYMKKDNEAMKKSFINSGVFSDVLFANHNRVIGQNEFEMKETLVKRYDEFFEQHNIDLKTIDDYITVVDGENPIGIYLTLKNIKYCLAENTVNWFQYVNSPKYWELLKDYGLEEPYLNLMYEYGSLSGRNKLVTPILYPESCNIFENSKDVLIFDYDFAKSNISNNTAAKIIKAYGVNVLSVLHESDDKKKALFVTASLAPIIISKNYDPGHRLQNGDDHHLHHRAHQLILDYYVEGDYKIVVKPHPGGPISAEALSKYYDTNYLISEIFPVDFFSLYPTLKENSFDLVITTGGSAAIKVEPYGKSVLHIPNDAYFMYYLFHRLYISLMLITKFKKDSKISFHFWGYTEGAIVRFVSQSKFFVKHIFPHFKHVDSGIGGISSFSYNTSYIIVPLCNLTERTYNYLVKTRKNTIIIFFDIFGKVSAFAERFPAIKPYLLQVDISKTKKKSDILEDVSSIDTLYVFCKNEKQRQEILRFTCEKVLPRTGIAINAVVSHEAIQKENITRLTEIKPIYEPITWSDGEGLSYESALNLETGILIKLLARRIIPGPLWKFMHKIKVMFK